jgi:hypothetical protein
LSNADTRNTVITVTGGSDQNLGHLTIPVFGEAGNLGRAAESAKAQKPAKLSVYAGLWHSHRPTF